MKKGGSLFVFICIAFFCMEALANPKTSLRILNWSEYIDIDPSVDESKPVAERSPTLKNFKKLYNIDVIYEEYDSEEQMFRQLEKGKNYYDIVVVPSNIVEQFINEGRIMVLNEKLIPNLDNILPKYKTIRGDPNGEFFIPYLVGTTGLVYRKDIVGFEVNSWKNYFRPKPSMKGKMSCFDTAYTLAFGLMYLGKDVHTTKKRDIQRSALLFYKLMKTGYITEVTSDLEKIQNKMLSGELAIAMMYSGEAQALMDMDEDNRIQYVIPREGSEFFVDCMVVLNDAPNKILAHRFLNYMLRPEVGANIAVYQNFITPNQEARVIIKKTHPEYFESPVINISDEVMKRLVIIDESNTEELSRVWKNISH